MTKYEINSVFKKNVWKKYKRKLKQKSSPEKNRLGKN